MWGCVERLGLQICSDALEGEEQASRASELAPIGGGCCLADCHLLRRLRPTSRLFPRPSIHIQVHRTAEPQQCATRQQAAARARRAKPGANAPARQSKATAAPGTLLTRVRVIPKLRAGGGRGSVTKPYHPTHPRPAPQTPAAAQAVHRRQPQTAPPAPPPTDRPQHTRGCASPSVRRFQRPRSNRRWKRSSCFSDSALGLLPETLTGRVESVCISTHTPPDAPLRQCRELTRSAPGQLENDSRQRHLYGEMPSG